MLNDQGCCFGSKRTEHFWAVSLTLPVQSERIGVLRLSTVAVASKLRFDTVRANFVWGR